MSYPRTWQDTDRKIAFFNDSGEEIPPFACMELKFDFESGKSAMDVDSPDVFLVVQKPTAAGARYPGLLIFNTGTPIANQRYGSATLSPVALAFFNDGDGTPDVGEDVGAKAGQWYVTAKGKGFKLKTFDSGQAYYVDANNRTILVEIDSNMLEVVQITSGTPDGDGLYSGQVQRLNAATLTWETLFTCKVMDANA